MFVYMIRPSLEPLGDDRIMETKKTIQLTLTPDEVQAIIRKSLGLPEEASVWFRVEGVEDPTDWSASQPLSYEMTEVVVTIEE